jgi:putative N6-adenine-specific DNA methylase
VSVYELLDEVFRQRCAGWRCWVFTGNPRLAQRIGLDVLDEIPLYNGRIPCRFLQFRTPA